MPNERRDQVRLKLDKLQLYGAKQLAITFLTGLVFRSIYSQLQAQSDADLERRARE